MFPNRFGGGTRGSSRGGKMFSMKFCVITDVDIFAITDGLDDNLVEEGYLD